jgi:hypothetical protein
VVRLTCGTVAELTVDEEYIRRLKCIRTWVKLQDRQEKQLRGKLASSRSQYQTADVTEPKHDKPIPTEGKPTQCIYSLRDESKTYEERTFEYSTRHKMMNHMEEEFLEYFAPDQVVPCPHYSCKAKGFVSPCIMAFKRHCPDCHKIFLRP